MPPRWCRGWQLPGAAAGFMSSLERRLRESWSENAGAWTGAVRSGGIESRVLATDAAVVQAALGRAPDTVLDVGCGEGWLAHRLAELGVEVTGFDASEELVRRAAEGPGQFHLLDYAAFAAAPNGLGGPFDVAVCNFSILGEEVQPLLRALREAVREGGALVIQTLHPLAAASDQPYSDGWREEGFRGLGDGFSAPMPWYFRTVGSWVRELVAAGFVVEEIREPRHPESGQVLSMIFVLSPGGRL